MDVSTEPFIDSVTSTTHMISAFVTEVIFCGTTERQKVSVSPEVAVVLLSVLLIDRPYGSTATGSKSMKNTVKIIFLYFGPIFHRYLPR